MISVDEAITGRRSVRAFLPDPVSKDVIEHILSVSSRALAFRSAIVLAFALLLSAGCSNDPYPPSKEGEKVLYSSFVDAPRTLDPATAYNTRAHAITGAVYDTLLKYHFLKRPLELIPGLARALPEVTELPNGRVRYRFELREDLLYANDECFELSSPGERTREVVSADVEFQLSR